MQRDIIQLWPGKEAVQKALGEIEGVTLDDDSAPCRQRFEVTGDEVMEQVREKAVVLGCHINMRRENAYDLLPYGIDKGTTLGRYIVEKNINPNSVLAIVEANGDQCLFGRGWRGATFAHAPQHLRDFSDRFHNAMALKESGPKGVLEAIKTHMWIERSQD